MTAELRKSGPRAALIIEDSPVDLFLAGRILGKLGYATETARSVAEAEKKIKLGHFDVLLLDLGLQDCSGEESYRRVREKAPEDLRICVVTGTPGELDAVEPGDHLLGKPLVGLPDALREAIA